MYAVSFGNCFRYMGLEGSAIWSRIAFQNSNRCSVGIHLSCRPQSATTNCTGAVRNNSARLLWSRVLSRSPVNVPLSSHSSARGSLVTIRCPGFKLLASHPRSRIYHDLAQVFCRSDNRKLRFEGPLKRCRTDRCCEIRFPPSISE